MQVTKDKKWLFIEILKNKQTLRKTKKKNQNFKIMSRGFAALTEININNHALSK